jgi:rubrerythrin
MGSEVFARRLNIKRLIHTSRNQSRRREVIGMEEKLTFHCDKCGTDWDAPASPYCPKCGELCSRMTEYKRMKAKDFKWIYGSAGGKEVD